MNESAPRQSIVWFDNQGVPWRGIMEFDNDGRSRPCDSFVMTQPALATGTRCSTSRRKRSEKEAVLGKENGREAALDPPTTKPLFHPHQRRSTRRRKRSEREAALDKQSRREAALTHPPPSLAITRAVAHPQPRSPACTKSPERSSATTTELWSANLKQSQREAAFDPPAAKLHTTHTITTVTPKNRQRQSSTIVKSSSSSSSRAESTREQPLGLEPSLRDGSFLLMPLTT